MTLRLQVNALVVVPAWLRAHSDVAPLATGGVKNRFESNQAFPACRVSRIGGQLIGGDSYAGERVMLQFDCLGGNDGDAWRLAETIRAALTQEFNGRQTVTLPSGAVSFTAHKVAAGGLREMSDTRPGADGSAAGAIPAGKPMASFDAMVTITP